MSSGRDSVWLNVESQRRLRMHVEPGSSADDSPSVMTLTAVGPGVKARGEDWVLVGSVDASEEL